MREAKTKKKITATEFMLTEHAKYAAMMHWKMAKALVEGKVDSNVLRYAEQEYETLKDVFKELI